jgi:hypothetical protein
MGEYGDNGVLDVTNCYPVQFEEYKDEPSIWFFNHIYHEQMFNMMRKIRKMHILLNKALKDSDDEDDEKEDAKKEDN